MKYNLLYFLDTSIRFGSISWQRILKISLDYQWYDEKSRTKELLSRINSLLRIISSKNIFYKKHLSSYKKEIVTLSEIKEYPILEKSNIRENYDSLISDISTRYKTGSTSGSTGIPLKFLIGYSAVMHQTISYYRFLSWYGLTSYDRNVLLWGQKKRIGKSILYFFKKLVYNPQYRISIFDLDEKTFVYHFERLLTFRPKFFRSYKSGAVQFADLAKKLNYDLKKIGFRLVIVTSEVLFPSDRDYLENAFGCRVANEYGASEIGQFAFECPEGSLHISDDVNYVFTNSDNELLVTSLHNIKFPFFNYKIGDKVILSTRACKCGRTLPVIDNVDGRSDDYIVKPNGDHLSQYAFYYLFEEIAKKNGVGCIKKYRITQNQNEFAFEIIKGENFNEDVLSHIKEHLYNVIGSDIRFIFKFSNQFNRDESGKLWFFKRI
ncbi:MAG: hypothetical protein MUC93_13280 [Bacteroidales bacterium]|jgi:phenylacetate-CoA ligase|nr:hypothetical protein [Bacteroidales bacterium]